MHALLLLGCTSAPLDSADACGPLRVATFNLLHGYLDEDPDAQPWDRVEERMTLAGPALASEGLTTVMLQEVVMGAAGGYPETAEMLRSEGQSLTFGDLFGTQPGPTGSGWGQATLTCHEVLASTNHVVEGSDPRSVLHTRVSVEGVEVDLFNVHISGNPESVIDVLGFVEDVGGERIVLGGDFNLSDGEEGLEVLGDAGFEDAVGAPCADLGDPSCTANTIPLGEDGNRRDERIDYLWTRGVTASDSRVLLTAPFEVDGGVLWASDHLPVAADVGL